jgi:hypothetical protein
MNRSKTEVQKAISELENPYPNDNLITCYKDFLKVRDFLPYYKYSIKVFQSLVDLTNEIWDTNQRINRISLLESLKKYGKNRDKNRGDNLIELPIETKTKIFLLFKCCFDRPERLSANQINEAKNLCNYLLINLVLRVEEEKWLCENTGLSENVLNRVLRYPIKSEVITNWVKENYNMDIYRIRRAELASWLIDEDPNFEIDKRTLTLDFGYFNISDIKAIQEYENQVAVNNLIKERELNGIIQSKNLFDDENVNPEIVSAIPELKLTFRHYSIPIDTSKDYQLNVPDFKIMCKDFYADIDTTFKRTMLWAIAYSRLDSKLKSELLKKYYCKETYWSFFRICKKHKLIKSLKWLKDKQ